VKTPWKSSFTSSSKRWCTHDVVSWVWQSYVWFNILIKTLCICHVTFDVNRPPPIHSSTQDTLRVSYRSLSCLESPVVWDLGEVWKSLQKVCGTLLHSHF
jgi:hypothetical protein